MTENQVKIKAEFTQVQIGALEIKGVLLETGEHGISISQVANLVNVDRNTASRDFRYLLKDTFRVIRCNIPEQGNSVSNVISLPDFEYLIHCLSLTGNKFARKLASELPINSLAYIKALDTVGETKKKLKSQQGYVYLLDSGVVLKLGYSTNVKSRIKALQRWDGELELLITKKGTLDDEQKFHRYLKATGESFGDEWYPSYRKLEILSVLDTKCLKESRDL